MTTRQPKHWKSRKGTQRIQHPYQGGRGEEGLPQRNGGRGERDSTPLPGPLTSIAAKREAEGRDRKTLMVPSQFKSSFSPDGSRYNGS